MRNLLLGGTRSRDPLALRLALLAAVTITVLALLPTVGSAAAARPSAGLSGVLPLAVNPTPPANASVEGWYHLNIHSASPALRDSPAMAFDGKDGYVLLFGGCAKPVCPLLDTWKYQANVWTNLTGTVATPPAARSGAAMVYDVRDGYVVLFGGLGAHGALSDTWTFQYGRWTQVVTTPASAPPARYDAGLLYDSLDSEVVLYGGESATGAPLADTWAFAGGVWSNITASAGAAPPARFSAGFAYDTFDRAGILFGGSGVCGALCGDTWSFASGRWTNLTTAVGTNVPSPRAEATLAFDNGRGLTVLIGGENGVALSDTWGFSHGLWSYLTTNASSSPGTRANVGAAYDPSDGYLVTYGGHNTAGLRPGSWVLLTPLSLAVTAAQAIVQPGQADQFSSSASGGLGPFNVSWNFGDASPVVTGPSAGHTYLAPGSYPVTATVTDSLEVAVAAAVTVSVQLPAFSVSISASPASPVVGQSVTFLASVTGGSSPFAYQWSGDVANCGALTGPTLTCTDQLPGALAVSVTVVDVSHRSAVASTSVAFGPATGLAGRGTAASLGASGGLSSAFTSAYLTVAIFAACAVGVVTYRAGRRREAARNAVRPLCYAVPAWSETPPEFPSTPAKDLGADDDVPFPE